VVSVNLLKSPLFPPFLPIAHLFFCIPISPQGFSFSFLASRKFAKTQLSRSPPRAALAFRCNVISDVRPLRSLNKSALPSPPGLVFRVACGLSFGFPLLTLLSRICKTLPSPWAALQKISSFQAMAVKTPRAFE